MKKRPPPVMQATQTTDRIRRAYRNQAPRYDPAMRVTSRLFFAAAGVPVEVVSRTKRGVFWRLLATRPSS